MNIYIFLHRERNLEIVFLNGALTVVIWTCHSGKSTGEMNDFNDGSIPLIVQVSHVSECTCTIPEPCNAAIINIINFMCFSFFVYKI